MKTNYLKELGERIRTKRAEFGLSQEDLAEKIGTIPSHMSDIENGKVNFGITLFLHIVQELQVSADWLLRADTPVTKQIVCSEISELLSGYSSEDAQKILTILTKAFFLTAKGSSGAPHPLRLYKFLL